jgi:predicted porin
MKKTLVAIASLAALGALSTSAMAQSSMTIYGNLDQTVYNSAQGGKTVTSTASNANSSSYWGITSTEDIGGGLKASFDLRSEITLMTGQAASTSTSATNAGQTSTAAVTQNTVTNAGDKPSFFNRGAFVQLAGGFGALKIGRQGDAWWEAQGAPNTSGGASFAFGNLTAMQNNTTNYSSLVSGIANSTALTNYAGSASAAGTNVNPTFIGVSEAFMGGISYTTPAFSGFKAQYQVGVPKVSYNDAGSANNGYAYALMYDGMGASLRVAGNSKNDYSGTAAFKMQFVGGAYQMGQWRLSAGYNKLTTGGAAANTHGTTAVGLGLGYNVSSALSLNVAYGTLTDDVTSSNKFTQTGVQAYYKLSPRSTVYAGIGTGKNDGLMKQTPVYGGAGTDTTGATVNAYLMGIKHTF